MAEKWYIDSWSVLDGIAFASLRNARDWKDWRVRTSTTSVLIGPPDWRAVSISRVSTALRATRGLFQESVFDDNDQEIQFESLEDIRDIVRRAYIAGGLGLDGPGELEGGPEVPFVPSGTVPKDLLRRLASLDGPDARLNAEKELLDVLVQPDASKALDELFQFMGKRIKPWYSPWTQNGQKDWTDYVQWSAVTLQSYATEKAAHDVFSNLYSSSSLPRNPYWELAAFAALGSQRPVPQRMRLLFRLPALGGYPDYPPLRTLGDQLLLACASRKCLKSMDDAGLLAVVMAATVFVTVARVDQMHFPERHVELVLKPAIKWLTRSLPPKRDDSSPQSRMLEEVIQQIANYRFRPPGTVRYA